MRYRPEIDGLRAIAIIPVVLYHANIDFVKGGYVGVDVFFVISGYLITSIILADISANNFSLLDFYIRRVKRILPALFVMITITLPFAWSWLLPSDMSDFSESLIGATTFTSNFIFWHQSNYFAELSELKPLLHTWSLAVEEQYYIIFPIFILYMISIRNNWLLHIFITIFFVSFILANWGSIYKSGQGAFYLLPTRGWELMAGALAAYYLAKNSSKMSPGLRNIFSITGIVLIFVAIFCFNRTTPTPSIFTAIPVLGAALIVLFADSGTVTGKVLGSRLPVFIGLISYSLYLWHNPIFSFYRHFSNGEISEQILIILLVASAVCSFLSWRYIERPFRKKGPISRKKILILIGLSAVSIFFGVAGKLSNGFDFRIQGQEMYKNDTGQKPFYGYLQEHTINCVATAVALEAPVDFGFRRCMQSNSSSSPTIALFGDSHAEHYYIGLSGIKEDENVIYLYRSINIFQKALIDDKAIKYILETPSLKNIVVSFQWRDYFHLYPNHDFHADLQRVTSLLAQSGRNVFLVDDIPRYTFPAKDCKYSLPLLPKRECASTMDKFNQEREKYFSTLQKIAKSFPNVFMFSNLDTFCDGKKCSMIKDGDLMYRDHDHLNITGSKFLGFRISEMIKSKYKQ